MSSTQNMRSVVLAIATVALLATLYPAESAHAQRVLIVNSTGDDSDDNVTGGTCHTGSNNSSGHPECTLRAAVEESNFTSAVDTIRFAVPDGTDPGCSGQICTIETMSQLFADNAVYIDGASQPGASCLFAQVKIVVEMSESASGIDGLIVDSLSTVRGLAIQRFTGGAGLTAIGSSNVIQCNVLVENLEGLRLLTDGSNLVGTDGDGVEDDSEPNVIAANTSHGVSIDGTSDDVIAGNQIAGNGGHGVLVGLPGSGRTSRTVIGGDVVAEANVIEVNTLDGIAMSITSPASDSNAVLRNAIKGNGGLGIDLGDDGATANDADDLDIGTNLLQNFPVLTSVEEAQNGDLTIIYSVDSDPANSSYPLSIRFYRSDAGGVGGSEFLGSDSYPASRAQLPDTVTFSPVESPSLPSLLVATATSSGLNTSEFSAPIAALGNDLVVNTPIDTTDMTPGDGVCYTGRISAVGRPECSLRAAIDEANARAGADTVTFDIDSELHPECNLVAGICRITLDSALAVIDDTLYLDGVSQGREECNLFDPFKDRKVTIELDGTNVAGDKDGIHFGLGASASLVRGIAVMNFPRSGIRFERVSDAVAQCNHVGTDGLGATAQPNGLGIVSILSPNTLVGTNADGIDDELEGNLVLGNTGTGIEFAAGSTNGRVSGNFVGVKADFSGLIGNGGIGIRLFNHTGTVVGQTGGSTESRSVNYIGGNAVGVQVNAGGSHTIAGNNIGGGPGYGNIGAGFMAVNTASNVTVGRDGDGSPNESAEGNQISHNGGDGVDIRDSANRITLRGNLIFENGGIGIDLNNDGTTANDPKDPDAGPNRLQNSPVFSSVLVDGDSAFVKYTVDSDTTHADYPLVVEILRSQDGQGQSSLALDTVAAADWHGCGSPPCEQMLAFERPEGVPQLGDSLVATATDSIGNTSEFSAAARAAFTNGASLAVRAFLEGPFASGKMSTDLVDNGLLQTFSPFSGSEYDGTPLKLFGGPSLQSHADSTVDWVHVSLRTSPAVGDEVATTKQAALIHEYGLVTTAQDDSLRFAGLADGAYYVVLRARNHLDVMSDTAVVISGGVGSHDFRPAPTTDDTTAYGVNAQKLIDTGVWGMFAGDGSISGGVDISDFALWLVDAKIAATGYLLSDFDLDTDVNIGDFALWLANAKIAASSGVPD